MDKYGWSDLPQSIRNEVQSQIGIVAEVDAATVGQSCHIATTLIRDGAEPVFFKGVKGISPEMRWLRNEAEIGQLARRIAPAVLFSADVEDWFVVGFEHVTGRPANLAPGSADLSAVATTLARISSIEAPEVRELGLRWKPQWWSKLAGERPDVVGDWDLDELMSWEEKAPPLVQGNRLIHTDLHEDQFIISEDGETHVIDWGWPASGAAWVDAAFIVVRMIGAGHRPPDAERWASRNTNWSAASEEAVTAFAVFIAGLWNYKATTPRLAKLARSYAGWRLRWLD
ncbi:phosphotransferase family protein [Amycolatopsis minnesotensis]|uniref:Aminoglycoside phosphotransferase domain-containing protein n=1 Tax=Amycolatopsis minnesotensis TaxID=337894 RepID=A0ABN2QVA7_9PSEU